MFELCFDFNELFSTFASQFRGVAQPGSVLAWGARGRGFESRHPDEIDHKPLIFSGFFFFPGVVRTDFCLIC